MHLRPHLWGTLATALGLALTLGLAAWQLQRHGERNAGREQALAAQDLSRVDNRTLAEDSSRAV